MTTDKIKYYDASINPDHFTKEQIERVIRSLDEPGACPDCDGVCCVDDLRCPDCERAVKEEARIKQFWKDYEEEAANQSQYQHLRR